MKALLPSTTRETILKAITTDTTLQPDDYKQGLALLEATRGSESTKPRNGRSRWDCCLSKNFTILPKPLVGQRGGCNALQRLRWNSSTWQFLDTFRDELWIDRCQDSQDCDSRGQASTENTKLTKLRTTKGACSRSSGRWSCSCQA